MDKPKQKEIIYFRESLAQSLLADLTTFGSLVFSFWFNYNYIGNNTLLNAVLLVMLLMIVNSRASEKRKDFTSKKELLEYLQSTSQPTEEQHD